MAVPVVTVKLRIRGEDHEVIVTRDLSVPTEPERVDTAPHSFEWTGRHDHGPLATPELDCPYGHLVDALKEAKIATDRIISVYAKSERPAISKPAARTKQGKGSKVPAEGAGSRAAAHAVDDGDAEEDDEEDDEEDADDEEPSPILGAHHAGGGGSGGGEGRDGAGEEEERDAAAAKKSRVDG